MKAAKRIDQMTIKESNKQNILNGFEKNDYLMISDMIRKTGLTSVTSNAIIKDLLTENWIVESHYGESSGGRKPMVYKFNKDRNNLLQLSISKKSIHITVMNLRKEIKCTVYKDVEVRGEEQLVSVVDELLNTKELSEHLVNILAIAVNVPGVIDHSQSKLLYSSPLEIKNFDFQQWLNEFLRIDVPVYVFKRVDGLLMEAIEHDKRSINAAYILIDDGLGLSVTLSGNRSFAMRGGSELGHVVIRTGEKTITLGDIFRDDYLLEVYNKMNKEGEIKSFNDLLEKLEREDDLSENSYVKRIEEDVSIVCANVVNLFAPEKIVIGGKITDLLSIERLREYVERHILTPFKNDLNISTSTVSYEKLIDGSINYILNEHVFRLLF